MVPLPRNRRFHGFYHERCTNFAWAGPNVCAILWRLISAAKNSLGKQPGWKSTMVTLTNSIWYAYWLELMSHDSTAPCPSTSKLHWGGGISHGHSMSRVWYCMSPCGFLPERVGAVESATTWENKVYAPLFRGLFTNQNRSPWILGIMIPQLCMVCATYFFEIIINGLVHLGDFLCDLRTLAVEPNRWSTTR